jgi:hypothetical protein
LADWLEQKKTIAAQNLWLAQHTNKVPVDLTLTSGVAPYGELATQLDFYLMWLGLRASYETPLSALSGFYGTPPTPNFENHSGDLALQLRLFGGNVQDTNLIVRVSYEYDDLRAKGSSTPSVGDFAGAYAGLGLGPELQIYFANWLGVRGDYSYDFSRKHVTQKSLSFSGHRYSAVAFLEMGSFRFEGGYESRVWNFENSNTATDSFSTNHSGLVGRLRVFF